MMAFILALAAAFLGSIGIIADSYLVRGKNPRAISSAQRLAWGCLLNAILLGAVLLVKTNEFWFKPIVATAFALLAVGILDGIYNYLYLKAMEKTAASGVNPIVSLSPIVTLVISTFLPGVVNVPMIFFIVLLIVPGIYLITLNHDHVGNTRGIFSPFKSETFKLSLIAAVSTGVAAVIIDRILENGYTSELSLLFVRMLIIAVLTYTIFRPKFFPAQYRNGYWFFILVAVEMVYVVDRIMQTYAIGLGNVSLVVTIASTTPLFVVIFDALFLKERITLNKLIGTALIVVGTIIAALQMI